MPIDKSLHALNRYTCRKILEQLRRGPMTVAKIHALLNMGSRASVSQALARLFDAGLVTRRRQGRNHLYELRPAALTELFHYLERFYQRRSRVISTQSAR